MTMALATRIYYNGRLYLPVRDLWRFLLLLQFVSSVSRFHLIHKVQTIVLAREIFAKLVIKFS